MTRWAAAKNGRAIPCDVDATKFMLSYPRGAYTGARTVDQTKIFDYEGHIRRLVESTIAMEAMGAITAEIAGRPVSSLTPQVVENTLRPRTEATLRAAMAAFKQQYGTEPHQEYKITVLVCPNDEEGKVVAPNNQPLAWTDVYCHIGLLPPLRSGLAKLQVAGHPRHNASAKDTEWVRERKALYDAMPSDVEELILMNPQTHELLEGSQTNFFAIQEGKVVTAEHGILKGTVRSLVLEVCEEHGIPVNLIPPCLDDVGKWGACFISSTSRLVLGVGSLEYVHPVTHERKTTIFSSIPLLELITTSVRKEFVCKSTSVFDDVI